jgi:DNA-binding transcriptional MerR regulator
VSSSRELVKLYYRIGEVSQIVGVQPHVLRYWETEFRTIRPQKSHKGQRVYSRKDVEKLLRVKDLLKNQGFTIAGAKKKLRDPELERTAEPEIELRAEVQAQAPAAAVAEPLDAAVRERQTRMREALVSIREDIVAMLEDGDVPPRRPKLPSLP